jgi:ABC-type bacteriocin/lantibiotic exporter with double-glycine peptidase domain
MSTNKLTPTQRFWRLLQPDSREIHNIYAYAIFAGIVSLTLPLGIQAIVNLIQGGMVSTSWIVLVAIVVLGVGVSGVLQIFQLRITENLQQKIFARAAMEFAYRIPRIRLEALYRHHAPELMNRFFDTLSVQKGLSKILIDFTAASLQVIFGLILLSFYHPFFILFSLVLVILVFAIFRFTAKRGLETSLTESKFKYKVAHWLEELARTSNTFKLAGRTELPLQRTDNEVAKYLEAREGHFKVLVRQYSMLVAFKVIIAAGLLAIGGILVMEQLMNIGQFIAAEIIILIVMSSVEKLILSLETIYDVLTALEKIGQVTDLELERGGSLQIDETFSANFGLAVNVDEVSFRYPDMNENVIDGLTLEIPAGEKWLITGKNGSGKSTLLQLIAGIYDPNAGHVAYNGIPKGNLDLEVLRDRIGDCLSHELLFEGSLMDNLVVGRRDVAVEDVRWAVKGIGLEDFVRSLPAGYDTGLDPLGKRLPKSIAQKLLLVRAIVDRPRLLILEDALEHVDESEKRKIIDFLVSNEVDWTLIAVSADPYFATQVDRVVVLERGKLVVGGGSDSKIDNKG